MLMAARELHRFFHDAREALAMINEKDKLLTDDLGKDVNSVHHLQRSHQSFESDLAPLVISVSEGFVYRFKTKSLGKIVEGNL